RRVREAALGRELEVALPALGGRRQDVAVAERRPGRQREALLHGDRDPLALGAAAGELLDDRLAAPPPPPLAKRLARPLPAERAPRVHPRDPGRERGVGVGLVALGPLADQIPGPDLERRELGRAGERP